MAPPLVPGPLPGALYILTSRNRVKWPYPVVLRGGKLVSVMRGMFLTIALLAAAVAAAPPGTRHGRPQLPTALDAVGFARPGITHACCGG